MSAFTNLRPKALRVLGKPYVVTYEDLSGQGNLGLCHNPEHEIDIHEGQPPIEEADTLLHEVMHAIFYQMGIGLSYKQEEHVVRRLATGLTAVFQDNPSFLKYLAKAGT